MAKKVKVQVDVESNLEPTIANLKALKKQLKETAAGSADFNRISQQIRDMDDAIKDASKTSDDFAGYLENASGPLGMLGKGIRQAEQTFSSFNAVIKASVIGLLVAAIGGLVAAFSQSERATKKLQPLLIGMEKILNGIFAAVEPLFDAFIDLATKALPYVTEGIGVAYSAITSFLQGLGKLAEAVGKLIKGDFTGAWESAKESVTGFGKRYDEANQRFIAGTKEVTKTEKENLKERNEAAEKALQEKLKRMEAEDKLDEASLAKLKAEALAVAETEQQKLDVEKAFAKKSRDLRVQEIEDKQKLYKKDSAEYKTLQAEKIGIETEYVNALTGFADQQKKINETNQKAAEDFAKKVGEIKTQAIADQLEKDKQARADKYQQDLKALEEDKEFIKKSEAEKAEIRKNLLTAYNADIKKLEDDAKIKQFEDDLELLSVQQRTLIEGTKAYLDNSIAIENTAYAIKVANAKDNKTKLKAIEIEHEQNMKDIRMKAAIAEKQIQLERLGVIAGIGNSLAQLAGKNKALAIAAIAIEKAAAVGSIIVNTQLANIKALAASPLTAGMPWIAINNIAGGLAIAATVAAGVKAVQDLNAVNIPGASVSGGSAGGSAATLPSYGGAPTTSTPQIQTQGGANPATQISQTIQQANQMPIRAYVVSNDITSQQALDRKTNRGATFGLG